MYYTSSERKAQLRSPAHSKRLMKTKTGKATIQCQIIGFLLSSQTYRKKIREYFALKNEKHYQTLIRSPIRSIPKRIKDSL